MNVFILLYIGFLCFNTGFSDRAFRFQKDSKPTTNSVAIKTMDPSLFTEEKITSLSFSLWVKVDYFRSQTFLVSYAISDRSSNQIGLGVNYNQSIVIMGERTGGFKKSNFKQDEWYHMAAVFDDTTNYEFYINGKLDHTSNKTINVMYLNGTFVLGQEMDTYIGGFVDSQSFSGWISHFNVYNRTLDSEEIGVLSNCETAGDIQGDILSWNDTDWKLRGIVSEEEVEICGNDKLPFTMILEKFTLESSKTMCMKLFRSHLYTPQSQEENDVLFNETIAYAEECKSSFHRTAYTWLGGRSPATNASWIDHKGRLLNWTNFLGGPSENIKGCAALQEGSYAREWSSVPCRPPYELCPTCSLKSEYTLTMRGLCGQDVNALFLPMSDIRDKISFKGFTRFHIVYVDEEQTWLLNDIWNNETLAKLFVPDGSYPLGTKEWEVVESYKICSLPEGEKTTLSLANCKPGEFNCDDGTCIPMDERCDLRTDCSDCSDEDHCDKLIKPDHYLSDLLAPGTSGNPLNANLSVTVTRIFDVDVRAMKVFVDLVVAVSWYDRRLSFRNLKNISDYNVISADDIWVPELEYLDTDSKDFFESSSSLLVTRMGKPDADDISRVKSDEIYDGKSNYLTISWKISVPLHCDMFLYDFPFDEQKCKLKLKLKSSRTELINWGKVMPRYTGTKLITEYEVGTLRSSISTDEFGYNIGSIEIPLSRRYSYYITTAYVPTYMLVLISYMSFFCKTEHVDLRVMMTITTLLVLYSLYQQIEGSLPKTAYTKAIDVWCFFCLTIIMTQVIFHIVLELNFRGKFGKKKNEPKDSESTENLADGDEDETERVKKKMLLFGQFIYAIIQFAFVAIYVIVFYFDLYSNESPLVA